MNMGHTLSDIAEMYHKGMKAEEISSKTKTDIAVVKDVIKQEEIELAYAQHHNVSYGNKQKEIDKAYSLRYRSK